MRNELVKKLGLAMLVVCLLMLSTSAVSLGKTRLEFWGFANLVRGEQEIIQKFQAAHPDIELVFLPVPEAGLREKILMAAASGIPPAVTIVKDTDIPSLAMEGVLLPLDDLMKRDGVKQETWVRGVLESNRVNGSLYAINQTTDVRALFYNKALFAASGYDPQKPPATWDELANFTKRLTKVGGDGKIQQIGFTPLNSQGSVFYFALQNGAKFLSADGRKAALTDSTLKDAVLYMKSIYEALGGYKNAENSPAMAGDEFLNGKMAMSINGNWRLNTQALDERAANLDWAVTPTPVPSERYQQKGRFVGQSQFVTWSGGWRYAIPANYKDTDAAWELLKYLTSVEGLTANAKGEFADAKAAGKSYVPRFTANIAADRYMANEYLPYVSTPYQNAQWFFINQLNVTTSPPISPVTTTLWNTLAQIGLQTLRDGVNPDQAFADAQQTVQTGLDQYYQKK